MAVATQNGFLGERGTLKILKREFSYKIVIPLSLYM
jgi:hypothetical protein